MTAALAGANLIYGLGMLDLGMTFSFAQLVMDNEFARMIKHVVRGIPVTDDTLAVDHIKEVGSTGDFLTNSNALDYTLGRYKRLQSTPKLIDRNMREDWERMGSTDIVKRAEEEARYILETHRPEPLSDYVRAEIRAIVEETEKELGVFDKERTMIETAV